MAFVLEDRVVETANNPGQGDFELLGASGNNHTFVAGIGNGNTTRYLAIGAEGWEIGIAEVSAGSPDRLLRPGNVTKNSDGGTSPINFTGTVTVACVASVEDVLWRGADGDVPAGGGRDLGTAGDPWRNLFLSGSIEAASADLGIAPFVSDLNDVTTTRAFTASADSGNIPPGGGAGVGLNIARAFSTRNQVQLYFGTGSGDLEAGVWARAGRDRWQEGASDDWWRFVMESAAGDVTLSGGREIYHQQNIVGPVAVSGGLPSGSVIEQGANSNGRYVRYADGTQICFLYAVEDRTASGVHRTDINFPATFVNANIQPAGSPVAVLALMLTTVPSAISVFERSTTGCSIYIDRGSATAVPFFVLVIGRWF